MFDGPIRGGTRGGQGEFKWSDVSADKDRENYLGHSINAPTGRWQKNKDVHWYNRESGAGESERLEEIRKIKEAEADALAVALGFKPAPRPGESKGGEGQTEGQNESAGNGESAPKMKNAGEHVKAVEESKEERRRRKEERRQHKEEKRARKEARRALKYVDSEEEENTWRQRQRSRPRSRSRSRSPLRRELPAARSRSPGTRWRRPREYNSGDQRRGADYVYHERERYRGRWDERGH